MVSKPPKGPASVKGSTVQPTYTERKMRYFSISESEMKNIGLTNLLQTSCIGVGSAMLAFALDIFKNTTLAESVPTKAAEIASYAQQICVVLGLVFYLIAGLIWFWRSGMINTIKRDSVDDING